MNKFGVWDMWMHPPLMNVEYRLCGSVPTLQTIRDVPFSWARGCEQLLEFNFSSSCIPLVLLFGGEFCSVQVTELFLGSHRLTRQSSEG